MSDPTTSTGRTRMARDTDKQRRSETPAEETLRQVLSDVSLPTAARVAADSLIDEMVAARRAQEERLDEIAASQNRWLRIRHVIGTVSVAGVASALATVAAALLSHADAKAEERQRVKLLDETVTVVHRQGDEIRSLRIQATEHRTLLNICTARLGVLPPGAP